jgi:membrane protein YqaA with SNARE-associated domain
MQIHLTLSPYCRLVVSSVLDGVGVPDIKLDSIVAHYLPGHISNFVAAALGVLAGSTLGNIALFGLISVGPKRILALIVNNATLASPLLESWLVLVFVCALLPGSPFNVPIICAISLGLQLRLFLYAVLLGHSARYLGILLLTSNKGLEVLHGLLSRQTDPGIQFLLGNLSMNALTVMQGQPLLPLVIFIQTLTAVLFGASVWRLWLRGA